MWRCGEKSVVISTAISNTGSNAGEDQSRNEDEIAVCEDSGGCIDGRIGFEDSEASFSETFRIVACRMQHQDSVTHDARREEGLLRREDFSNQWFGIYLRAATDKN